LKTISLNKRDFQEK